MKSWSLDDDMTIAGSTVIEHAFRMGVAGCGALVVLAIATSVWRNRHRVTVMLIGTPIVLLVPALIFHDGFLA